MLRKIGATGGVDTATNAANAISLIDDAISLVSTRRGEFVFIKSIKLNNCKSG